MLKEAINVRKSERIRRRSRKQWQRKLGIKTVSVPIEIGFLWKSFEN